MADQLPYRRATTNSNKYHDYNLISNNLVLRSLKMSPSGDKWPFRKKRKIVKMINTAHGEIILKPNKLLLSPLPRAASGFGNVYA